MHSNQYSLSFKIDDSFSKAGRSTATDLIPTIGTWHKRAQNVGNLLLQRFPEACRIGMASQRHISK